VVAGASKDSVAHIDQRQRGAPVNQSTKALSHKNTDKSMH
jgi:hypothetical protein